MRRVCSILGRMIVALAGLSVVAAATNSNVVHAGGYNSADAPLIITIAVLLVAGMGTVGVTWRNGQRGSAFLLALFLLSGEAYWFGTNADREWKSRQEAEAPIAEAQLQRGNADRRLELALEAKKTADAAAISEAAKPGCRKECRILLQGAAKDADTEVKQARAALEALPQVRAYSNFSALIGLPDWLWELGLSLARSLAVMGGSLVVGLVLHPGRQEIRVISRKTMVAEDAVNVDEKAVPFKPIERPQIAAPTRPKIVPLPKSQGAIVAMRPAPRKHVLEFLKATLKPDPDGEASLRALVALYHDWCTSNGYEALPLKDLGAELRAIVDEIGLDCQQKEKDLVVVGAAIAA